MANEVEIVITGHDRSEAAFASAERRAKKFRKTVSDEVDGVADDFDAAGDKIEKDLHESFDKVQKDAKTSLDKVATSIEEKISSAMAEVQKTISERLTVVEHESEGHGHRIGGGLVGGIRSAFSSGLGRIREPFDRLFAKGGEDGAGRGIGRSLISGIVGGIKGAVGEVRDAMKPVAESAADGLKGAFSSGTLGPMLITGLVGVILAALPAAGTLISGALLGAIGAGLVGLGGLLALHLNLDGIKDKFKQFKKDLVPIYSEMVQPMVPVIESLMGKIKQVLGKLAPEFGVGFKIVQDQLDKFLGYFGDAFAKLEPAIRPGAQAFADLINAIGPRLPGVFENISDAIINLAQEVSKDKDLFANLFEGLLNTIPLVINMFSGLMDIYGRSVNGLLNIISMFGTFESAILTGTEKVLGAFRLLGQVMTHIPGMEGLGRAMVAGIDTAINKIHELQGDIAQTQLRIEVRAEINDLQSKISTAKAMLNDPDLTKERRATLNAEIGQLMAKLNTAYAKLGDKRITAEYRANLNADISRLLDQLHTAKSHLNDKDLTKDRKAQLKADIAQLLAGIRQARKALDDLNGKTVNTYVKVNTIHGGGKALAHGGIVGAAAGGPRGATVLVGEQGPEIVELPYGSMVVPAGQTRSRLEDEEVPGYAKGGKVSAPKTPHRAPRRSTAQKHKAPAKKSTKQKAGHSTKQTSGAGRRATLEAQYHGQIAHRNYVEPQIGTAVSVDIGTAVSTTSGGGDSLQREMVQRPLQHAISQSSRSTGGGGVVINVYVQGSIRSDKEIVALIRNEIYNGGLRGVLQTA